MRSGLRGILEIVLSIQDRAAVPEVPEIQRARHRYALYKLPLMEFDVPALFIRVTDADPMALAVPLVTVNGRVRMNWLPYCAEVLFWNQAAVVVARVQHC